MGCVYGADGAVQLVASSWHFKLFHEENARSNNPQVNFLLASSILRRNNFFCGCVRGCDK